MPGIRTDRLTGGVRYWHGQFDDARLAVALTRTAIRQGACVLSHCRVTELIDGPATVAGRRVRGVVAEDRETGRRIPVAANCVINATGVWVDVHNADPAADTKRMSREHVVLLSATGLVTVTGGKWTTYRAVAEDVLKTCFARGLLPARPAGRA